jgi:Cof subfamily protein (haloacid dehalogenase superfamily)
MPVKLLAIDLDGTLLTETKQILPSSVQAIYEARSLGVTVVLASGRIAPSMRPFAEKLDLADGPIISGNGTYLALAPGNIVHQLRLPTAALEIIANYALSKDIHLNIYTAERLFFLRETPWGDLYRSRVETVVPEILDVPFDELECLKVLLVDHPERIQTHARELAGLLNDQPVRATESEPEYLEYMDDQATKGFALSRLANLLGIVPAEVAAIGDYLNDIEMVQYAGVSGAMGNGHPLLKDTAKHVVSTNEQGGISEFIGQFVLKQNY